MLDQFALRNPCVALQNSCPPQLIALLGLISRLQGDALQNTIAEEMRANMLAGYALLGIPSLGRMTLTVPVAKAGTSIRR